MTLYRWDLFWFRNARDRRDVGIPQKWSKSVFKVAFIPLSFKSKFWDIFPYSSFHLYKDNYHSPRTIQGFVSDTTFGLKDFRSPNFLLLSKKNGEPKSYGHQKSSWERKSGEQKSSWKQKSWKQKVFLTWMISNVQEQKSRDQKYGESPSAHIWKLVEHTRSSDFLSIVYR